MKIPKAFNQVCRRFCQDIGVFIKTEEELLAYALEGVSKSEMRHLKLFLNSLLSNEVADDEVKRIWDASPAEVYFQNADHLKLILTKMRDQIDD